MTTRRAGINRNMYVRDAKRLANLPIAFSRSATHVHTPPPPPLPEVRGASACKHKLAAVCCLAPVIPPSLSSLSLPLLFTLFRPYSGSKQRGDARANASFQLRAAPGMRCYPGRVTGAPVLSARAAGARMPW